MNIVEILKSHYAVNNRKYNIVECKLSLFFTFVNIEVVILNMFYNFVISLVIIELILNE